MAETSSVADYLSKVLELRGPTQLSALVGYVGFSEFRNQIGSGMDSLQEFLKSHPNLFHVKVQNFDLHCIESKNTKHAICLKTVYLLHQLRTSTTSIAENSSLCRTAGSSTAVLDKTGQSCVDQRSKNNIKNHAIKKLSGDKSSSIASKPVTCFVPSNHIQAGAEREGAIHPKKIEQEQLSSDAIVAQLATIYKFSKNRSAAFSLLENNEEVYFDLTCLQGTSQDYSDIEKLSEICAVGDSVIVNAQLGSPHERCRWRATSVRLVGKSQSGKGGASDGLGKVSHASSCKTVNEEWKSATEKSFHYGGASSVSDAINKPLVKGMPESKPHAVVTEWAHSNRIQNSFEAAHKKEARVKQICDDTISARLAKIKGFSKSGLNSFASLKNGELVYFDKIIFNRALSDNDKVNKLTEVCAVGDSVIVDARLGDAGKQCKWRATSARLFCNHITTRKDLAASLDHKFSSASSKNVETNIHSNDVCSEQSRAIDDGVTILMRALRTKGPLPVQKLIGYLSLCSDPKAVRKVFGSTERELHTYLKSDDRFTVGEISDPIFITYEDDDVMSGASESDSQELESRTIEIPGVVKSAAIVKKCAATVEKNAATVEKSAVTVEKSPATVEEGVVLLQKVLLEKGPLPVKRLIGYVANADKAVRDTVGKNEQQLYEFVCADDRFIVGEISDAVSLCSTPNSKPEGAVHIKSVSTGMPAACTISLKSDISKKSKNTSLQPEVQRQSTDIETRAAVSEGVAILERAIIERGPLPVKNLIGYFAKSAKCIRDACGRNADELYEYLRVNDHFVVKGVSDPVTLNPVYQAEEAYYKSLVMQMAHDSVCDSPEPSESKTSSSSSSSSLGSDEWQAREDGISLLMEILADKGPMPLRRLVGYLGNTSKLIRDAVGGSLEKLRLTLIEDFRFAIDELDEETVYLTND